MRCLSLSAAVLSLTLGLAAAQAQEGPPTPMPGPEHAQLKALEGTWGAQMKMPDAPTPLPGVMTYKMECGGLWLASDFKSDAPGFKFQGKGFDGYDPLKKKYVSVWVDSMVTAPIFLEGTFDEKTKTLTMVGEAIGLEGKPIKYKNVTKTTDNDHQTFQMFSLALDGKEKLEFTIEYTRKK